MKWTIYHELTIVQKCERKSLSNCMQQEDEVRWMKAHGKDEGSNKMSGKIHFSSEYDDGVAQKSEKYRKWWKSWKLKFTFFYSRADPSEIWDDDDAMLLCNRFIVREGMLDKRRIFHSRQSSWNLAGLYLDNRNHEKFREISRINTPENLNEMLLLCI